MSEINPQIAYSTRPLCPKCHIPLFGQIESKPIEYKKGKTIFQKIKLFFFPEIIEKTKYTMCPMCSTLWDYTEEEVKPFTGFYVD